MIWNFWIWVFLVQRWPFRDAYLFFKKEKAETPISIVFWGCAFFGPSCQKRKFWTPTPKKILTDNWKAHFWESFVFFPFFLFCFFWLFFCLVVFFPFPFFVFNKKPCVPHKGHFSLFAYFWVFPFFSPWPFLASPFSTFFFSASLLLSSFFLPSRLYFALSFGSLFLSLSFFISSLFLFHEKSNIKIFNFKVNFSSVLSHFCWFPLFFFHSNPLSLSLFFFYVLLFVQHQWFSKKTISEEGGCNITVLFMNLCFGKCQKLSFFGGLFLPIFGCFSTTL